MNIKKILLCATALTPVFSTAAHADPISGAIAWIGTTIAAGGVTGALVQMALGVGTSIVGGLLSKALSKNSSYSADVKFDVEFGDDLPLSFTVGNFSVSGKRKYIGSWGKSNRFITEVIEVSCMPQGLSGIWIDDEKGEFVSGTVGAIDRDVTPGSVKEQSEFSEGSVPSDYISIGTPLTNYSDDGNRIYVKFFDGKQTTADPLLVWAFGSDADYPWTNEFIGKGKSYAVITVRYDSDTLTSYPTYLFEPVGLAMYDPRKDTTVGGSGSHRWGNFSTYETTTNGAVICYNIARGIYYGSEWVYGGQNLSAWRLPLSEWTAAMNEWDSGVTGEFDDFICGLELYGGDSGILPLDALQEIGKVGNMSFAELGGIIKPMVGLPATSILLITDGDIIISEGQTLTPFSTSSDTYTAISSTYPEPEEKWSSKDAGEYVDADATSKANGEYRPISTSYPATSQNKQVQYLQRAQIRDNMRERVAQFYLPPSCYELEPIVDAISWTSEHNNFNNKMFVIESIEKLPTMNISVTIREVDPEDYDPDTSSMKDLTIVPPVNEIPFTQTVDGFNVVGVSIKDSDGDDRKPALRISVSSGEVKISEIIIWVKKSVDTNWQSFTRPYLTPYIWDITEVLPDTNYDVKVALKSSASSIYSESEVKTAKTPSVLITEKDLAESVYDEIEAIAATASIPTVNGLPSAGTRDNQIVLNSQDWKLYRWNATTGTWTTTLYAGIPDGSVTLAKFASDLEPIRNVTSIPSTKVTSTISYNGELYRWNGTAYVKTVNATDIAGQIANAQIAAVAASKVTGQMTDAQIAAVAAAKVTGQISSAQIADAAITNAKLGPLAVQAANIANSAITETKISDSAITTPKIAANAVVADKIAANVIAARHLVLSDQTNLLANGGMDVEGATYSDYWTNPTAGSYSTSAINTGLYSLLITQPSLGTSVNIDIQGTLLIPVNAGDTLYGEVSWRGGAAASAGFYYRILWFDETKTETSYTDVVDNAAMTKSWQVGGKQFVVPTGAKYACIRFYNHNTNTTSLHVFVGYATLRRAGNATLIVDGSVIASKVAAGAIQTEALAAGAVVADTIAANAITTAKIAAGAVEAGDIAAGAVTTIKLDALAVTTEKIAALAITASKIAANSISAASIQAGAINADHLAAGAIVASKMFIGDTTNLVQDSDYLDGANMWALSGLGSISFAEDNNASVGTLTKMAARVTHNSDGSTNYTGIVQTNLAFGVAKQFVEYFYTGEAYVNGGATTKHRITWYNGTTQLRYEDFDYTRTGSGWYTFTGSATAPANATAFKIAAYIRRDSTATTIVLGKVRLTQKATGDLIVDGVITANKISTGAVTADAIAAGAVIASKIAAGAITAVKIDTVSFSAAGLAVFGGTLQSSNFNATTGTGWQITQAGNLTIPNASITSAKIGYLEVGTSNIAENAITKKWTATGSKSTSNIETWVTVLNYTWDFPEVSVSRIEVSVISPSGGSGGAGAVTYRVFRNGANIKQDTISNKGNVTLNAFIETQVWGVGGTQNFVVQMLSSGGTAYLDATIKAWGAVR